jgi:hypothetical protein
MYDLSGIGGSPLAVTGRHLALRVAIINSIGQANPGPRPITASRPASRISADEVMEQLRPHVLMSQRAPLTDALGAATVFQAFRPKGAECMYSLNFPSRTLVPAFVRDRDLAPIDSH